MSELLLNGIHVKPPKSFSVSINDVDGETGRNANGDMVRDRITTKRKIELEWGMLTQDECSAILNAVSPVFFDVSYPDPILGQTTKTVYVGDRSAPRYSFVEKFKPWSGLKMNLIER